ncbi:hypothetical protein PoB_001353300 [Plakobranchus ocellatus]|uniref:Uncharacterized protein n=1 Tax=Plakobranchus ocellatus TaxID=259542 RepID=A0AAV3YXB8_9GAST|nr:hypothetical protein PoB_001353300 [Plakobranchus ocellatus]
MYRRDLPPLQPGENIRYRHNGLWEPAQLISKTSVSQSYNIRKKYGNLWLNRQQLFSTAKKQLDITPTGDKHADEDPSLQLQPKVAPHQEPSDMPKRTRSGRVREPPEKIIL